jgi:uncharacterized protein YndB with AHSA1/START domain
VTTRPVPSADAAIERAIRREIDLAAPIERVWRALADPRELERWFPLEVRGDVAPGAALTWSWIDFDWRFRVEQVAAGRRLVLREDHSGAPSPGVVTDATLGHAVHGEAPPPCVIDFALEPGAGGATRLRLVHSGFSCEARWDELYDGTGRGWDEQLALLAAHVARVGDQPVGRALLRAPLDRDWAAAWALLTGPAGLLRLGPPTRLVLDPAAPLACERLAGAEGRTALLALSGTGGATLHLLLEGCYGRPELVAILAWPGADRDGRRAEFERTLAGRIDSLFPGGLRWISLR